MNLGKPDLAARTVNHRRGCGAARIRGVLGGREGAAASPSSAKAGSVGGPPGVHGIGLIFRARNEDSLKVISKRVKITAQRYYFPSTQ